MSLDAKPVSASQAEMTELVLPNDANVLGTILGGRVMHLVDLCGAIAAARHAQARREIFIAYPPPAKLQVRRRIALQIPAPAESEGARAGRCASALPFR